MEEWEEPSNQWGYTWCRSHWILPFRADWAALLKIKTPYTLVNCHITKWKDPPFFIGKSSIHGPCSIAMLNYRRVIYHVYSCKYVTIIDLPTWGISTNPGKRKPVISRCQSLDLGWSWTCQSITWLRLRWLIFPMENPPFGESIVILFRGAPLKQIQDYQPSNRLKLRTTTCASTAVSAKWP